MLCFRNVSQPLLWRCWRTRCCFRVFFSLSLDQINLPLHFCSKQITPPPFSPKTEPLSDHCALFFLSMQVSRFLDYNPGSSKATDEICGIEIHIFKGFNFLRDILLYIPGLKPTLVFISTYGRGLKWSFNSLSVNLQSLPDFVGVCHYLDFDWNIYSKPFSGKFVNNALCLYLYDFYWFCIQCW